METDSTTATTSLEKEASARRDEQFVKETLEVNPTTQTNESPPSKEDSKPNFKHELAARLRKRIEDRVLKTTTTTTSAAAAVSDSTLDNSSIIKQEDKDTQKEKEAHKGEEEKREEEEVVTVKTEDTTTATATNEGEIVPPKEKESDEVEGFQIFCDDAPMQCPPLQLQPPSYDYDSPSDTESQSAQSTRKATSTEKKATSATSPRAPGTNSFFGPSVVKTALLALGGKAPAVQIADWIATNKPQYLEYFGEKKKLRYSVSGILSARAYSNLFQKTVIIQKGIKKAEWILIDDSEDPLPHPAEGEVEGKADSASGETPAEALPAATPPFLKHGAKVPRDVSPYDVKTCQICGSGTDDDKLLLCDACDCGYHMYCLEPNVTSVPKGYWFCEYCAPEMEKYHLEDDESTDREDMEEDGDTPPDGEDLEDGEALNPRACEKHRRWKKRCPSNCPLRKLKASSPALTSTVNMKKKRWRVKRKMDSDEADAEHIPKKYKGFREGTDGSGPTYIEMIEEAIAALGGKGTTPDITAFMESNHGDLLATKTRTWRNSVSGCLSTHFIRASKDALGRTIWGSLKDKSNTSNASQQQSMDSSSSKRVTREHLRAPSRSSGKLYDPEQLQELRKRNPADFSNKLTDGIEYINRSYPLETLSTKLLHPGSIFSMTWSSDGNMLATVSSLGSVRIWDTSSWKLLQDIRDKDEKNIEEFYTVLFANHDKLVITAGKRKDRNKWNNIDDDNEVLPSLIKIFDVMSGKLVQSLAGHAEEVLCIKLVRFEGKQYLVSASQDGTIIKWGLSDDFRTLEEKTLIEDRGTQIAIYIDFIPHCGNKFFVACCDGGLKIFDFETHQVLQTFPDLYGYLCDCVKFVECTELPAKPDEYYLLTRGVEMVTDNDQPLNPNTCHLRKLTLPDQGRGKFKLEEVNTFSHKDYQSNIWLMKLSTNGRYVLAPTTDGKVFVWNMRSTELVAILHDHNNREVRDILFHPTRKLLVTCADDSSVRIYEQKEKSGTTQTASPVKAEAASSQQTQTAASTTTEEQQTNNTATPMNIDNAEQKNNTTTDTTTTPQPVLKPAPKRSRSSVDAVDESSNVDAANGESNSKTPRKVQAPSNQ